MKNLLLLLILFAGFNGFSQSLEVDQTFIINKNYEYKPDLLVYPRVEFTKNEKEIILSSILNHLEKELNIFDGWIFDDKTFKENGELDSLSNFDFRTINNQQKLFKKDSILFEYHIPKLDEFGERIYDDEGDEVYILNEDYYSFNNSFIKLNSKEKWNYENYKLTKTIMINGIDVETFLFYQETIINNSYYSNTKEITELTLLKKDVKYTHYFYPEYYEAFLRNDSIQVCCNSYSDYIEIGLKASAQNNQFDVSKFLQPIFDDIHLNKLNLFRIDTNNRITSNKVKAEKIIDLFRIVEEHKVDENGEPMFDDEGDDIYITSKYPILPSDILGIEFYEDWYIGKDAFQLKKNLKGIILISAQYDKNYVLVGMKKNPAYISFE